MVHTRGRNDLDLDPFFCPQMSVPDRETGVINWGDTVISLCIGV